MHPSHTDVDEILRQSYERARRIAMLEKKLENERQLRAVDARWLVRNTELTRTQIAGVVGISRVTLDKYLDDAGMDEDYLQIVRKARRTKGIEAYSPDISQFLDTAEQA